MVVGLERFAEHFADYQDRYLLIGGAASWLDDEYYGFLHDHKIEMSGVSLVSEVCLPLKARAWLDLTKRKQAGENIDSRDIKKHRTDVLRLYQLIDPGSVIELPEPVRTDLAEFLDSVEQEVDAQLLTSLSITGVTPEAVIQSVRNAYAIADVR